VPLTVVEVTGSLLADDGLEHAAEKPSRTTIRENRKGGLTVMVSRFGVDPILNARTYPTSRLRAEKPPMRATVAPHASP
jgi:hypothetical protein